jgi:hypothetical protein
MTLPEMAPRFPELQDAGWLRRKYELEGLSSYAIAAELGCRPTTISRALRRHGIAARMGRLAVVAQGQIYGRLTALAELAQRTRGGRVFRCLCACGRETDARAVELRQGRFAPAAVCATRHGRAARRRGCKADNATGGWSSLHEAKRESSGDARMFTCGCDCGGTTTVRGANLTSGHTRSCGCLLEEYRQRGTRG